MNLAQDELLRRAAAVELLVLDVDGVLTDGGLFYGPTGEAMKRFNVKDGHGLVMARLAGLKTAILTARTSPMVEIRAKELRITSVLQGQREKGPAIERLAAELGVPLAQCAYMGDDTNDLDPLSRVGLTGLSE